MFIFTRFSCTYRRGYIDKSLVGGGKRVTHFFLFAVLYKHYIITLPSWHARLIPSRSTIRTTEKESRAYTIILKYDEGFIVNAGDWPRMRDGNGKEAIARKDNSKTRSKDDNIP